MAHGPAGRRHPEDELGTESREAQSAWLGGGRVQLFLSVGKLADANEGSQHRHHPLVWAAAWTGGVALAVTLLILFVR
jgi:hypothetical protein